MGNEEMKGTSKLFCSISDLSAIGCLMSLGRYIKFLLEHECIFLKAKMLFQIHRIFHWVIINASQTITYKNSLHIILRTKFISRLLRFIGFMLQRGKRHITVPESCRGGLCNT